MEDDEFEWDDAKAAANIKRHRIGFPQARRVFRDPFVFTKLDETEDYGEDRYIAIGLVGELILAVAFTERGIRIRIISARKANSNEQREYHSS